MSRKCGRIFTVHSVTAASCPGRSTLTANARAVAPVPGALDAAHGGGEGRQVLDRLGHHAHAGGRSQPGEFLGAPDGGRGRPEWPRQRILRWR
mgnify:CR=1 FL=1